MIQFTCVICGTQLTAPDHKAGGRGKCPNCQAAVEVPSASPDDEEMALPAAATATLGDPGSDEDEGVIPLAGISDQEEPETMPSPRAVAPAPRSADGIVITPMQDITVVSFQAASILDAPVIQAIGSELYVLVDQKAMRKIILDFSMVKFLSSQMLGVLVSLHKKSAAIKGRVVLCGLRPEILKVFAIMNLNKVLTIVDNEAKACEVLGMRASA